MVFCPLEKFISTMSGATLIISRAGLGTIIQAVKLGKPLVVVPRKAGLREANGDHEFTTARILEAEGKILVANSTDDITLKLKEAENFVPATACQN